MADLGGLLFDIDVGVLPRHELEEVDQAFPDAKIYGIGSRPKVAIAPLSDPSLALLSYWSDDGSHAPARRIRLTDGVAIRGGFPHTFMARIGPDGANEELDPFLWLVDLDRQPNPPAGAVQGREFLEVQYLGMTRNSVRNRLTKGHESLEQAEAQLLKEKPNRYTYILPMTLSAHKGAVEGGSLEPADDLELDDDLIKCAEGLLIEAFNPQLNHKREDQALRHFENDYEWIGVRFGDRGFELLSTPTSYTSGQTPPGLWFDELVLGS